jgi:hypothetical protein
MERDMDGNQDVIDLKGDTTPVVNEIVDSINSQPFNEGDPNCSKCHGKGYYIENTFGIEMQVKCTCVDRYKELQHSKESTYKGKIKVNKGASLIKAMQCGLIPRRRVNDLIDFRELGDRASALCRENGETFDINDFDNYKAAMKNVLTILVANREMDYSLMLSAPNGFGKTTFVYSCIKLLLMNGKNVTPFIDLFDLAGLRLEYMSNTTWRRADDKMPGFTDTEKSIEAQAGYGQFNIKRKTEEVEDEDEEVSDGTDGTEPKPFIQMTDSEKDAYIQKMNKSYTYKDYLDSDILFCMLSVKEQAYLEISTLKAIMDYRGLRCKPTIILTDRDIEVYKTSVGMATDLYLLNDMLTKESKYATYDRALLVSVKKKRTKKLKIKPGETV